MVRQRAVADARPVTVVAGAFEEPWLELIANRLRALGHPQRLRILAYLESHGETSVQNLADWLDLSQQNVSRHLGLLHHHRLVARRREGRLVWYRVNDPTVVPFVAEVAEHVLHGVRESNT